MQQFRADLHIHSRFSRATSGRLTARHLDAWARVKGLQVLGTGDFTHPQWRTELAEQLVFDDHSGLYCLRAPQEVADELPHYAGKALPGRTLFMLQAEISSIYKRGGKVRKVHSLVYMPDLASAERFSLRLAEVGNLASDGRPILGLDVRNLLEMVLETDPRAVLVPAHIWTPWFSVFGSKSGFDSIEECFGDLASHVFALETGLSSDPEMNWQCSMLDRFALISNSDAHSGENLGREANLFEGELSYDAIFGALRGTAPHCRFRGTLEFFPEEGKYHLDGHRNCGVVLEPAAARTLGDICPVCGKPLTIGVLHRVLELADRDTPQQPHGAQGFASLIPLPEVIGEVLGVGAKSRRVQERHVQLVHRFGPELAILRDVPEADLRSHWEPLGEAIARMRRGEVYRQGGYDGEYGVVRVFSDRERASLRGGTSIAMPLLAGMDVPGAGAGASGKARKKRSKGEPGPLLSLLGSGAPQPERAKPVAPQAATQQGNLPHGVAGPAFSMVGKAGVQLLVSRKEPEPMTVRFNMAQQRAIGAGPGPVLVLAGPGTGKTRTLVGRVVALADSGISTRRIVAVTFTRRAAAEMDERLAAALPPGTTLPRTDTLHALAFEYWHRASATPPVLLSEEGARRVFAEANPEVTGQKLREAWEAIGVCRERMQACSLDCAPLLQRYTEQKAAWNLADYTDLLEFWLDQLQNAIYVCPWKHVLVDEIQDLSPLQLTLVRALVGQGGDGFFGIGDPDQSIYGFRGAHGQVCAFLTEAWPLLRVVTLEDNYRSSGRILEAASALLGERAACGTLRPARDLPGEIHLFEAPTAESEASWIAERVRGLLGGTSHASADAQGDHHMLPGGVASPGEVAVLVRVKALVPVLQRSLARLGVPCAAPEVEAFWADQRVALILATAGQFLGIGPMGDASAQVACPDKMVARGPLGMSAYLRETPPFDALFWESGAFRTLVKAYDTHGGWAGLINWVNLQSELELVRRRSEKVQIMSLHAAKGLEFRAVFLPALEDGIVPFFGAGTLTGHADRDESRSDTDEERRLLYVGMTRASEGLYLTRATRRTLYGREIRLKPSRFLADIPHDAVRRSTLVRHSRSKASQLSLLGDG